MSDHDTIRKQLWVDMVVAITTDSVAPIEICIEQADKALAEFDMRFGANEPIKPKQDTSATGEPVKQWEVKV